MGCYGKPMEFPVCGVLVENAEHVCGDKAPQKKVLRKESK